MKNYMRSKQIKECTSCEQLLLAYDVRLVDGGLHYCLACAQKHHAGKERRTYKADSLNIIRGWRWWWRQVTANLSKHFVTLSNPIVKLCLQFTTWLKNNQKRG